MLLTVFVLLAVADLAGRAAAGAHRTAAGHPARAVRHGAES